MESKNKGKGKTAPFWKRKAMETQYLETET